jgi:ferrous iron transport protein B
MFEPPSGARVAAAPSGVILVGNPNVGKSVMFGLLTKTYVVVSNYPGTTVEITRGHAKIGGGEIGIIDTPGVNNLLPESEDEKVTRDILLDERAGCVVQIADAKNLHRSLILTIQLAEMGLPLILDVNMLDEARSRGIDVDVDALSEALGVPVVRTVAVRRQGLGALRGAIEQGGRLPRIDITYDAAIEQGVERIVPLLPRDLPIKARSLALMLLARDPVLDANLDALVPEEHREAVDDIVRDLATRSPTPPSYRITSHRHAVADRLVQKVLRREEAWRSDLGARFAALDEKPGTRNALRGFIILSAAVFVASLAGVPGLGSSWFAASAAVAMVVGGVLSGTLTSATWGFASASGMLYLIYLLVGGFGAGVAVDFLFQTVFADNIQPWVTGAFTWLLGDPETSGPIARFIHDFFVGPYGALTMALAYAIAIILPLVGSFFLAFGILEDSGYLPRLAVMMNRVFKIMGLNGKAVLPMILGLGCGTMATLTARILPTRKERVIVTLLLALAVPCSAQLGIILGMLAEISLAGTLWWLGTVLFVMILVGRLAARVVPGSTGDFILELPPLRIPKLGNVLQKTVARMEWYMKEAVPLFFLGTAILFVMDRVGALQGLIRLSAPVIQGFLGLPADMAEIFLMGFLRRDYGMAGMSAMWRDGGITPVQAVVALTTITLFIPCLAQWFVMLKERGWRMTLATTCFILPFALMVGGAMNGLFRLLGVTFVPN